MDSSPRLVLQKPAPDPPLGWWAALVARQRRNELAQPAFLLAVAFYIVALFTARRALISLSPVVLLLTALLNQDRRTGWKLFWRNPAALLPVVLYGWLLLSGFITEDMALWRHQLFRQLPLLVVPLAVVVAPPLAGRHRAALGAWWLIMGSAVVGATLIYYFQHKQEVDEGISISHNLAAVTGVGHIYFGVMLAVATLYGMELALGRASSWSRRVRWLAGAGAVFCALAMHVLAYRTGLLALYAALAISAIRLVVVRRKVVVGLLLLAALVGAPFLAYYWLESVQRRVDQTRYDLSRFQQGEDINQYSLSQRLAAWHTAGALVQRHWLLGVGPADVSAAMTAQYARQSFGLRPENQIRPHNQYLQHLLGGGVLALALLLAMLLLPALAQPIRAESCARHLVAAYGAAFLVDSMLEVQYGFAPFVLQYAILIVGPYQRYLLAHQHVVPSE